MMKKLTILALLIVTLVGCSKQYFSVVVWNEAGEELKKVKVWDNNIEVYSMGVFVPNAREEWMSLYTPLTEKVKLTWTEADSGIEREVHVDMDGVIPKHYDNGVVHFTIESSDKVSVNFYYKKKTNY